MISGPDPVGAIQQLVRLRLFPAVFTAPPPAAAALGEEYGRPCASVMASVHRIMHSEQLKEAFTKEEQRLGHIAALLLPLRDLTFPNPKKKTSPTPLAAAIVREGIKWRTKDGEHVAALHLAAPELLRIAQALQATQDPTGAGAELQVALGRTIKQLAERWQVGALMAAALQLPDAAPLGVDPAGATGAVPDGGGAGNSINSSPVVSGGALASPGDADVLNEQTQSGVAVVQLLVDTAAAWKLDKVWTVKPLLDGKALQAAAKMKPGPQMGQLTKAMLDWQYVHPDATADDCRAWIADNLTELLKGP